MSTSTLTSKGQITLPKDIRAHLHLSEGDQVDFVVNPDGSVGMCRIQGSVSSLAGILQKPGRKTVSLEEMDEAIVRSVAERTVKYQ
jgi:AbrB family looped-hinge helix DNA binding protein